jgi:hypothetical protein
LTKGIIANAKRLREGREGPSTNRIFELLGADFGELIHKHAKDPTTYGEESSSPPLPPLPLCERDLKNLRESGLTDETIRGAGLRTEYGFRLHRGAMPRTGLFFPYRNLDGEVNCFGRLRPHPNSTFADDDDGKGPKYLQPKASPRRAYYAPATLDLLKDGESDVYVPEGEKKALAVSQLGLATVGVGGVWCGTRKNDDGEWVLIDDLAAIPWKGRRVYITFDYDPLPKTRRHVAEAARRLAKALYKAGAAEVFLVELPPGPKGAKQGVDDFLVANDQDGDKGAAAFRELVERAKPVPCSSFANFDVVTVKDDEGEAKHVWVGKTPAGIRDCLTWEVGNWPKRVGGLLFAANGSEPRWLPKVDDLFAWVGGRLREPVKWASGPDKVTKAEFAAYLRQEAEGYEAVEPLPHYPPLPGHYYLHPKPAGGDGKALGAFLDRFRPATPKDRELMKAAALTPFWGGPHGKRPLFLVAAEDSDACAGRGPGKSTFVHKLARVAGGHFDARPEEDFGELMHRLLTPSALSRRLALLDNVKSLRFSWADLEGLITNDVINGHRMYSGDAGRPNTLTWFITLNHANLSKDMAQRAVTITVARPEYTATWEEETNRFIEENRHAIIGDALALLSGPKARLKTFTRWGPWEAGVLACVNDPAACQKLIAERQAACDGDQEESDLVREAFVALLEGGKHDPLKDVVFVPNPEVLKTVNEATGENRSKKKLPAYLKTLAIPELRKGNDSKGHRGWRWVGAQSEPGQTTVMLRSLGGQIVAGLTGGGATKGKVTKGKVTKGDDNSNDFADGDDNRRNATRKGGRR